mmetsp:Transcript_83152/g.240225  ORF Transcript_83152/g.240225 Transcript_83152/m.240225 type:complete len:445 (-) Transcript_83152:81-1415(-)
MDEAALALLELLRGGDEPQVPREGRGHLPRGRPPLAPGLLRHVLRHGGVRPSEVQHPQCHDEVPEDSQERQGECDGHLRPAVIVAILQAASGDSEKWRRMPQELSVRQTVLPRAEDVQAQHERLRRDEDHGQGPHDPEAPELHDGIAHGVVSHGVQEADDAVQHGDPSVNVVVAPLFLGLHEHLEVVWELEFLMHRLIVVADEAVALVDDHFVADPGRHSVARGAAETVRRVGFGALLLALLPGLALAGLGRHGRGGVLRMAHERHAEDVTVVLLLERRTEDPRLVKLVHRRDGQPHLPREQRGLRTLRPQRSMHRQPQRNPVEHDRHEDTPGEERAIPIWWGRAMHADTTCARESSTDGEEKRGNRLPGVHLSDRHGRDPFDILAVLLDLRVGEAPGRHEPPEAHARVVAEVFLVVTEQPHAARAGGARRRSGSSAGMHHGAK